MKKLMVGILIILLTTSMFVGCSKENTEVSNDDTQKKSTTEDKSSEKKIIGALIGDFSDQFHSYIMDGIKVGEAELGGEYEVVYLDAKYDQNLQLSQVENLIAQGVDAICVIAVDKEASKPMIEMLNEENIPIVSISNRLGNQELAQSFVGSENVIAGEIEMQAVADAIGGKGNIVILEGMYGHDAQRGRREGYENILKNYPDIKIVAENTGKWARAEGMKVMENWLQGQDEINAVVAENDEMALGAMMAIEDAGLLDEIVIAGVDATPEAIEYLKKGSLNITVFQDGVGQGKKALLVAAQLINAESVESEYDIPYELVSVEEADKYLAKYGK